MKSQLKPTWRRAQETSIVTLAVVACAACSANDVNDLAKYSSDVIVEHCATYDEQLRTVCVEEILPAFEARDEKQKPMETDILYLWADALRRSASYSENEEERARYQAKERAIYKRILERDPEHSDALYFLARAQEKEEDSVRMLKEIVANNPSSDAVYTVLSSIYGNRDGLHNKEKAHHYNMAAFTYSEGTGRAHSAAIAMNSARDLGLSDDVQSILKRVREMYGADMYLDDLDSGLFSEFDPAAMRALDKGVREYCETNYLYADKVPCAVSLRRLENWNELHPGREKLMEILARGKKALKVHEHGVH